VSRPFKPTHCLRASPALSVPLLQVLRRLDERPHRRQMVRTTAALDALVAAGCVGGVRGDMADARVLPEREIPPSVVRRADEALSHFLRLERRRAISTGLTKVFIMAQRTNRRPVAPGASRGKKPGEDRAEVTRLAESILANPKAASVTQVRRLATLVLAGPDARKQDPRTRSAADATLEDRLEAKAARADRSDFSGPSLGEMSREQRHKLLYGE
jgi:hypothetical protein